MNGENPSVDGSRLFGESNKSTFRFAIPVERLLDRLVHRNFSKCLARPRCTKVTTQEFFVSRWILLGELHDANPIVRCTSGIVVVVIAGKTTATFYEDKLSVGASSLCE